MIDRIRGMAVGMMSLVAGSGLALAADSALNLEKVHVGTFNSVSDAAIFVAMDRGYFREQGIDIDVTQVNSGIDVSVGLTSGDLDVAGDAPSGALYSAIRQGFAFKLVADKGSTPPGRGYCAIVVRNNLADTIKIPADLRGRTFGLTGYSVGVSFEATMHKLLDPAGVAEADIKFQNLALADILSGLGTGVLDAGILIEPLVTRAVDKKIAVIWKRTDAIYPDQQFTVLVYGPSMLKRPMLGRKFMVGYLKGARFYNDVLEGKAPRDELVNILVAHTSVKDPALYERMVFPGIDPNGKLNLEGMKQDMAWFVSSGRMKLPVALSEAVDTSFAEAAVKQLGPYR
jgi:NitT/TauT family transport system substrate-binding protein